MQALKHALKQVHSSAYKRKRLLKWSIQLQQYNLTVHHVRTNENVFADYISCHVSNENIVNFEGQNVTTKCITQEKESVCMPSNRQKESVQAIYNIHSLQQMSKK